MIQFSWFYRRKNAGRELDVLMSLVTPPTQSFPVWKPASDGSIGPSTNTWQDRSSGKRYFGPGSAAGQTGGYEETRGRFRVNIIASGITPPAPTCWEWIRFVRFCVSNRSDESIRARLDWAWWTCDDWTGLSLLTGMDLRERTGLSRSFGKGCTTYAIALRLREKTQGINNSLRWLVAIIGMAILLTLALLSVF